MPLRMRRLVQSPTSFNLSVGVLLRIPSEMVNYSIEKDKDSVGVTVLLVTAVMVIGLVVSEYFYHVLYTQICMS